MTTQTERTYLRAAAEALWSARDIKQRIHSRPERYDIPKVREILNGHVRAARRFNHLALQHRQRGGKQ